MPLPDLIPRDVLFGYPERTAPTLSPDGTQIAYLAPAEGALAVWVRTIGKDDDRVVASDPARPIRTALWSPDGTRVLYMQDAAGDENFHLFAADPNGGTPAVDLTPGAGTRVDLQAIDYHRPDRLLLAWNRRDPELFDIYALDTRTGETTLVAENDGRFAGFAEDVNLVVRAAVQQHADASGELFVRDDADAPWRSLARYDATDGMPQPVGFTLDGEGLLAVTSAGANAARLVRYDVRTGACIDLAGDPEYDVNHVVFSEKTKRPIAASIVRDRTTWTVLDEAYADDFATIAEMIPGDVDIVSSDAEDRVWLLSALIDNGSPSYWSYDRTTRKALRLFSTRPALERYTLAAMAPITYEARDGLTIHGYLTRPPGAEPGKRVPAIILVHGGPWVRDTWGYNGTVQWLANRGYAVLQPNYRSSTGYGKAFLNAGDREWAGAMRTDLLDAKAWLVREGIADPVRVAVMGGSYGGYATLTALAFEPLAFACGVDIVGPSNLNTLLASIPPYWETLRATFSKRMGEDPAFLDAQSPLNRAGEIRAPLLIGQGANDPRVALAESDQIVAAMRERSLPVTYVVFDDEGHGFARPENAKRFNAVVETFLAEHLKGRAEPAADGEDITPFLR